MTWVTDDGRHEGYAAYVTVDGREAVCTTLAGMHLDHRSVFDGSRWVGGEIRPWSELLGWEARCTCGWAGPLWRRPAGSDAQDACEAAWDGMTVEDAVLEVWKRHAEPPVSDPNGPFTVVHRAHSGAGGCDVPPAGPA